VQEQMGNGGGLAGVQLPGVKAKPPLRRGEGFCNANDSVAANGF